MSEEKVMTEIEYATEYMNYPVCPHCGYMDRDVFELGFSVYDEDEVIETECLHCEKSFKLTRIVTTTYSSSKV
jgi:hypothetical protein